jgi:hypothetical protein
VIGGAARGDAVRLALLFAFGLALRLLFVTATPDGGACWHVGFQGDAPVWQDLAARAGRIEVLQRELAHDPVTLARAIAEVDDVELHLPWRPPGMRWIVGALWPGEGSMALVRALFLLLGAATPPLVWLLVRPHVAAPVAWLTAVLCAASSNLLLLSSGAHVETAYLFVLLLALLAQRALAAAGARGAAAAIAWGLLHAAACLLRAEHLVVAVALAVLAPFTGARWRLLALGLAAAAAALVPWQLHVVRAVAEFNRGEPPLPPARLPWDVAALDAVRALPPFAQPFVFDFVDATVHTRGGSRVTAPDLEVVREAYGAMPEPIRPSFVAIQGAYSFWIANTPEANGGHGRRCFDREPPLLGGDARYPPGARTQRPRGGQFKLEYPPHADVFVHGYRRGLEEIAADPIGAARRVGIKLQYTVEGATGGLGGYALPIGLSGVRPSVDLVIATGTWPGIWRALVLAAAAFGWWRLCRVRALWPLLATAVVRVALIAAFFGHARHGALLLPVVMLGVAEALHAVLGNRWPRLLPRAAIGLLVLLPLLELVRASSTSVDVDGVPWLGPAGGVAEYEPHRITFR